MVLFHIPSFEEVVQCKSLKESPGIGISEPTAYTPAKLTRVAVQEESDCIRITESNVFSELPICMDKNR
jgi:hypothetical protein